MTISWDQFIQIVEIVLVPLFGWLVYEIRQTRESIQTLNVTMAQVITRIGHIEHEHGRRIEVLEHKVR